MSEQPSPFLKAILLAVVFIFTLATTFSVLAAFDLVPENLSENSEAAVGSALPETLSEIPAYVEPEYIEINGIGVNSVIVNPESRDPKILDEALRTGVVRYPGSASLTEDRPMFLFGHSSYLPLVHNSAYRAFNHLGSLEVGEEVIVYGGGYGYRYRVTNVRLDAASQIRVDLLGPRKLVMATCDSFGQKEDRFVVEADFVERFVAVR